MVGERSMERRSLLKAAGAGVLGTSLLTTPVSASTSASSARPSTERATGSTTTTAGKAADFVEHKTVSVDWDAEKIRYRFEYDIPSGLSEMRIRMEVGPFDFREISEASNFQQEVVTRFIDDYFWSGGDAPTLVIEDDFGSSAFEESRRVYRTDEDVFSMSPATIWSQADTAAKLERRPYSFDGGIARLGVLYTGPHEMTTVTVDDVEIALVVPDAITTDVDIERTLSVFEFCEAFIGGARLSYPEKTAFVVPSGRLPEDAWVGLSGSGGFWVREPYWEFDSIDNVPVHEYAHICLGTFGIDRLYWLTEASAEYYGYLCSLKAGISDFEEFHETATVSSTYATERLTDTETMRETAADYQKGAHVLVALDAEIRKRTEGRKRLLDIFLETDLDLNEYAGFKTAIDSVTNDQQLQDWVDQYVDGDGVPEIPNDETYFTTEKTQFDVSNLSSISGASNRVIPVTVEIRNKGREPGTTTVEFRVDGVVTETRTVELDRFSMQELTFELDSSEYEGGEHTVEVSVGEYAERTTFTVQGTAEFELHSLNFEPGEPTPGELVRVTAEIENAGDGYDQVTVGTRLVDGTGTERATNEDIVQLGGGVTESVTLDRIDTTDLDPGEYTLVLSIGGTETERTLQVFSPAELQIASFELEATELTQGDPLGATAEIENVGGATDSVTVALALESSAGNEQTVAERTVELSGQERETVQFDDIGTETLEPGSYTLRLQVGGIEQDMSVSVTADTEPTDSPSTESPTENADESDGSGAGFGIGSALAGLGGAGYFLKRRLAERSLVGEDSD